MADINRQILLEQIPTGKLGIEHFRMTEAPMPTPGEGELLVRTRYISLDAANRAWMLGATYRSALSAGQVMAGGRPGRSLESRAPGFQPGRPGVRRHRLAGIRRTAGSGTRPRSELSSRSPTSQRLWRRRA